MRVKTVIIDLNAIEISKWPDGTTEFLVRGLERIGGSSLLTEKGSMHRFVQIPIESKTFGELRTELATKIKAVDNLIEQLGIINSGDKS